jgi:phage/plasmid-like protein (TIGR03299 family)
MPAAIDSMMYTGQTPWHRLGTRLDEPATAEEAMTTAGLDWDVQMQPIYTGPDRTVRVKDRHVVCRADRLDEEDGGQLAVVGRDFTPLQNREAFQFLDPVVGKGGAIYHTAGSLRSGRRIWMLAKLPGEIRVVGDDITEKYVLLSNAHDGTQAVRVGFTPIRVVCQNTLNFALRGMEGISIRHYPDVSEQVKHAHKLLGIISKTYDTAGDLMQRMAHQPLLSETRDMFFSRVMPIDEGDDDITRARIGDRHERWRDLFETGDGNAMPGVRGTLWAGYNAVTQWVDRESYTARNKEPLNSIWFGQGERLKRHAFNVATEMIDASLN